LTAHRERFQSWSSFSGVRGLSSAAFRRQPLGADHVIEGFDCGRLSLNVWLVSADFRVIGLGGGGLVG
jgi:hypothetical protein